LRGVAAVIGYLLLRGEAAVNGYLLLVIWARRFGVRGPGFAFRTSFFDNLARSTALRTGFGWGVFEKFSAQGTFSIPEASVFGPTGINVGSVSKLMPKG